ncbi:MAG: hypothetical protein IJY08_00760 [Clostridia bacterium]|nr:hypothetical protein [Clostridia bacterium]
MSDRVFGILLAAILVIGCVCTLAFVGYTVYLHDNVSIISFISNER